MVSATSINWYGGGDHRVSDRLHLSSWLVYFYMFMLIQMPELSSVTSELTVSV